MADRSGRGVVQLRLKDHRSRTAAGCESLNECGRAATVGTRNNHPWATEKEIGVCSGKSGLMAPCHGVATAEANVARRRLLRDPHLGRGDVGHHSAIGEAPRSTTDHQLIKDLSHGNRWCAENYERCTVNRFGD